MPVDAKQHYVGPAGRRYQSEKRGIPPDAYPWVARSRAARFQPHILPSDTVLELGSGSGWNLAALTCARRLATDLEDFLPDTIKSLGVEFHLSCAGISGGSVDVVICHHVLEHVADPPGMLREASRLLRQGGKLLLHVPFEKESRYRRFDPHEPNHHLYSWNAQSLGNLATAQGFNVLEAGVSRFGYDRFAARWASRLRVGEHGFRLIHRLAHLARPGLDVRLVCAKNPGGEGR